MRMNAAKIRCARRGQEIREPEPRPNVSIL
jgi:hypothetical protein